jgi:hypothetical protein
LERIAARCRFLLEARRYRLSAMLTKELRSTLGDWQQANNALLRLNDPSLPLGKLDTKWLGEAAHNIEHQHETLRFATRCGNVIIIVFVG